MRKGNQIEVIIFRKRDSNYEFLLLKRILDKGGFWQPVTGEIESGETENEAVKREIKEETGINNVLRIIENVHCFILEGTGKEEFVFGAEITNNENINLDENVYQEHDEYRWGDFDETLSLLKWPGNKEGLKKLREKLK
jgi:8-oxo-dGTP pyrophosphatase MutT (NUDIX family)